MQSIREGGCMFDNQTIEYIRVASTAIALYDYLITLPAEWRFYSAQRSRVRISVACALFISIRYVSIALIVCTSYTFWYRGFTIASCARWHNIPASMKVVQVMASQAIMGWRTYIVSQRQKQLTWVLCAFYVAVVAGQWVTSVLNRIPVVDGNCRSLNVAAVPTAWIHYLLAVIYDVLTTGVVMFYLLRLDAKSPLMSRLKKLLLYHGLGYFLALTGVNLLNLLIFRSTRDYTQSAAVTISYTTTWIFSQKLLIHLNDISLKEKSKEDTEPESVVINVTRTVESSEAVISSSVEGTKESYDVDVSVRVRTRRRTTSSRLSHTTESV